MNSQKKVLAEEKFQSSTGTYQSSINFIGKSLLNDNSFYSSREKVQTNNVFSDSQNLQKLSTHKEQYKEFFAEVEQDVTHYIQQSLKDEVKLYEYKIVLKKHQEIQELCTFYKPYIYIDFILDQGFIVNYKIIAGEFQLSICLLNMNLNAPTLAMISEGAYGRILKINLGQNKNMVAKRINFHRQIILYDHQQDGTDWKIKPNKIQIQQVIFEYCIYKICSFFKIGPEILTINGIDLVCFTNCIEFYMEQCIENFFNHPQLSRRLKFCVLLMHHIKIIHKDIKVDNILYSPTHNKIVLTDFGISHFIPQQIGQLTLTFKQGTFSYCSPEMKSIKKNKKSAIDLYYNDLWGINKILSEFTKIKSQPLNFENITFRKSQCCQLYLFINIIGALYKNNKSNAGLLLQKYLKFQNKKKILERIKVIKNPEISCFVYQLLVNKYGIQQLKSMEGIKCEQNMLNLQFMIRIYNMESVVYKLQQLPVNKWITKFQNKFSYLIDDSEQYKKVKLKDQFSYILWTNILYYRDLECRKKIDEIQKVKNIIFRFLVRSMKQCYLNFNYRTFIQQIQQQHIFPDDQIDYLHNLLGSYLNQVQLTFQLIEIDCSIKHQSQLFHYRISKLQKLLKFTDQQTEIHPGIKYYGQQITSTLNNYQTIQYLQYLKKYILSITAFELIQKEYRIISVIVYLLCITKQLISNHFQQQLKKYLEIISQKFSEFGFLIKSINYAQVCISFYLIKNHQYCIIKNYLGFQYFKIGDYEKSYNYYLQSLQITLKICDQNCNLSSKILSCLAVLYYKLAQKSKHITQKRQSKLLEYYFKQIFIQKQIECYYIKGILLNQKALQILTAKQIKFCERIFNINMSICLGYKSLKNYQVSLQYCDKMMIELQNPKNVIEQNFLTILFTYYIEIAQTYFLNKLYDKALKLSEMNLKYLQIFPDEKIKIKCRNQIKSLIYILLAGLYFEKNDYNNSQKLFKKGLKHLNKQLYLSKALYSYKTLQQIYFKFNNNEKAMKCELQIVNLCKKNKQQVNIIEFLNLGDNNFLLKRFLQAIYFYGIYVNHQQIKQEIKMQVYKNISYCYSQLYYIGLDKRNIIIKAETFLNKQIAFKFKQQSYAEFLLNVVKILIAINKKSDAYLLYMYCRQLQQEKVKITQQYIFKQRKKNNSNKINVNNFKYKLLVDQSYQKSNALHQNHEEEVLKSLKIHKKYIFLSKKYKLMKNMFISIKSRIHSSIVILS